MRPVKADTLKALLFLFSVPCVFAQSRAVLFDPQLLSSRLAFERIVDVVGFFANQKDGFRLLFATACHEETLDLNGELVVVSGRVLLQLGGRMGKC